ncbi:MAG TPA: hypothetical protein VGB16_05165 [candidate division Zixibacteria bacterium]
MGRVLIFFSIFILLLGCSKYYRHGDRYSHTILIEGIFEASLGCVEGYLTTPQNIVVTMNKGSDYLCEVKESISFLENVTGIQTSMTYGITEEKLSEENSSFLAKDLEKWKRWYQDNKEDIFLSKDRKKLMYRKEDVKRIVDLSATRCWYPF